MNKYRYPIGPEFSNIYMDDEIKILARTSIPLILGITGPTKSGKTNLARTLSSEYGFYYLSLSRIITNHYNAIYYGIDPNWKSLGEIARRIRKSTTTYFFAEKAINEIQKSNYSQGLYVIDGVLHPDEIDFFSENTKQFIMIGLNPPKSVRRKYLLTDGTMTKSELIERDSFEQLNQKQKYDSEYYPNIKKCLDKVSIHFMYCPECATRKTITDIVKDILNKLRTKGLL